MKISNKCVLYPLFVLICITIIVPNSFAIDGVNCIGLEDEGPRELKKLINKNRLAAKYKGFTDYKAVLYYQKKGSDCLASGFSNDCGFLSQDIDLNETRFELSSIFNLDFHYILYFLPSNAPVFEAGFKEDGILTRTYLYGLQNAFIRNLYFFEDASIAPDLIFGPLGEGDEFVVGFAFNTSVENSSASTVLEGLSSVQQVKGSYFEVSTKSCNLTVEQLLGLRVVVELN